jgi:menaquinone-dependent protoporphyrinogen oxidase
MNQNKGISRRRFLALGAGATALACGGLGMLGMRPPEVEFVSSSCGNGGAKAKVLLAYASQCGSTGEVAQAIGQVLCESGAAVDVRLLKNVRQLDSYQAVVVGSAIRSSKWLPEAEDFVRTHQDTLSRVPVAYFATCMTLAVDSAEARRKAATFLAPLREQVQPLDVGLFAGKLDFDKLPPAFRLLWPLTPGGQVGEGDYRDWDAIRAWAAGLRPKLLG